MKKIPLNPRKDGEERLATSLSSTPADSESSDQGIRENGTTRLPSSMRTGVGSLSYFPDQVARVSYVASVVYPDLSGNYLKNLQDGMDSLATRLAPDYFPGTVVRGVSAQVDGYFPAPCPSERYTNCQDVTASIGLYLNAVPIDVNETQFGAGGNYNSYHNYNTSEVDEFVLDPSTMTEELIAFQESFEAAIANNELQEAIQQQYRQNQDENSNAPVVIVTDSIDTIDSVAESDKDDADGALPLQPATVDDASANMGSMDQQVSSAIAVEETDDGRDIGFATAGIIGTVLVSLLLVAFLAVSRRRRREIKSGSGSVVTKKIKKDSSNRRQPTNDHGDESGQRLLQNVSLIEVDDNGYDLEEAYTGRTMRTAGTESTVSSHTKRKSHEALISLNTVNSGDYSPGGGIHAESTKASEEKRNIYNKVELPPMEYNHQEEKNVHNSVVTSADATSGKVHTSFNNDDQVDTYDDKYDDDNEYVMCEDDNSDISIGEHLLNVTRNARFGLLPAKSSESENLTNSSPAIATSPQQRAAVNTIIRSDEVRKETVDSYSSNLSPGGVDRSSQKAYLPSIGVASSTDSSHNAGMRKQIRPIGELDVAIAKGDWAAVEATAAAIARSSTPVDQSPISRRAKQKPLSPSSPISTSDYTEKANELDKLIEAGDWEAVVVTAAKFGAEGEAAREDVSRSRTSTQGSESEGSHANDSFASNMDYSSADRSNSMGRSLTTTASQKERLQEIRDLVTQMVRDVVPEEVDNVDEMMSQFKGKEEELLETLRTMKERNVARKARVESQKFARRNTRFREKGEDAIITNENAIGTEQSRELHAINSMTAGGRDGIIRNSGYDFDGAIVDPDKAAADAAAWAIQRSLDELMEKEKQEREII